MTKGLGEVTTEGASTSQLFRLDSTLRQALVEFELGYFAFHLAKARGKMTVLSAATGLERTHLYRKISQLGIDKSVYSRPYAGRRSQMQVEQSAATFSDETSNGRSNASMTVVDGTD